MAGGALPVDLVARGSHSWRKTKEYLPVSCGGPRRTEESGRHDDPATVHENDHYHHGIIALYIINVHILHADKSAITKDSTV